MLRFKQPLCHHSDRRLVPAGRAALVGQPPVITVHTYERQRGIDSSKKIYYGVVFRKAQLKNILGQGKNNPFFHPLPVSLLFLYLSIQRGWELSGVAEKERESGAMSQ